MHMSVRGATGRKYNKKVSQETTSQSRYISRIARGALPYDIQPSAVEVCTFATITNAIKRASFGAI